MALEAVLVWLFIGAVSGWIAGEIVVGGGLGLAGDIIVGILGTIVAGYLLPRFGIHMATGLLGDIVHGAIGGIIVLLIISLIKRRR